MEAADPSSFASLVVLNRKWRNASQQGSLYAIQLMRCPSYSASHKKPPDGKPENLPILRRLFAKEVKRNLFDAYLRPNHTMIKLLSNSISSSSCPGGDGMAFSPSPKGHYLLAYNSSRIHVLDLRRPTISVEREFKILRRPVATCIKDDGSLLAVLLTEMQVDLYDLTHTPPKHTQSIILDHSPRAIALSPCGSVLAAAYEGGIEVQSLDPGALAADRRSVKCDAVDALTFSFDGTQILGTTVQSAQTNTVILTAPYYDPGASLSNENISALWTTSILFPNTSRDCSHAVLLQDSSHEEASWTFTYDRSFETFRAVRIGDLRNGTTYFTGPTSNTPSKLVPCTLPSASYAGELVSAGFLGKEVWLYGIPEDLEAVPEPPKESLGVNSNTGGVVRSVSGSSMRSRPRTQEAGDARVPQWQLLCDRHRNTFVGGFKAAELGGVSTVKWVAGFGDSSLKERLVITAKGATPQKPMSMDDDGMDFEDGGRITLVDFDYGVEDGCVTEVTIEVGAKTPEVLEEERRDMETEVAIVRRRTVAQRRGNRSAVMRAATTVARPTPAQANVDSDEDDPLLPRRLGATPSRPRPASGATEEIETEAVMQEQEALDAPYSHTGPRSITTLRRAATAAANHRRRNPTTLTGAPIQYRRADGRAEHPHESDADNWVPPPPPYQQDDPEEAPAFLRHSMVPLITQTQSHTSSKDTPPVPFIPPTHREVHSGGVAVFLPESRSAMRERNIISGLERPQSIAHQRVSSDPTVTSSPILIGHGAQAAAGVGPVDDTAMIAPGYEEDDIYNVSPPDTPRPAEEIPADIAASVTNDSASRIISREGDPSPESSDAIPYTGTQRMIPLVPRLQTNATGLSTTSRHPNTGPSPQDSTWNPHVGGISYTGAVIHSQTWPMPPHGSAEPWTAPTAYPYSAPPTTLTVDDIAAQSLPPIPTKEIPLGEQETGRQSALSRRTSTGFHLPRMHAASRSDARSRPLSIQQQPARAETAQSFYSMHPQQFFVDPQPLDRCPIQGMQMTDSLGPAPDQPLIISTPTGVQGAYDAPNDQPLGQYSQAAIVAPVPRHARGTQNASILQPAERLENIYHGHLGPTQLTVPPALSASSRLSSVNRRPSRAERSAARNMAEAKKKGWRRSRSKRKKAKQTAQSDPDFDMISQSAWTDVTWNVAGGGRTRSRAYNPRFTNGQRASKDKKCIVM